MVAETRFRVPRGLRLIWRDWADGTIVYHCQSGDTHRLHEVAARVVRAIEDAPRSLDEIATLVAEAAACSLNDETRAQTRELLRGLHARGLVEPTEGGGEAAHDPLGLD